MKKIIIVILGAVALCTSTPGANAWFGDAEKQRRIEVEQKLAQQERLTNQWQITAFMLGVGCVVVLVVGAAIGSKGRKDAKPAAN